MSYLLALDLGTTTCRGLLIHQEGYPIAERYCETPLSFPRPGWAEGDPRHWWHSVKEVICDLLSDSRRNPREILGIGFTALMHAPVLIDEKGQPIYPALLWMDHRSLRQAEYLSSRFAGLLKRISGSSQVGVSSSASRILWVKEHYPELFKQVRYFLLPKDFLRFQVTGKVATDPSDAQGSGLFDRRTEDWCYEFAEACGLRREHLPPILPSDHIAGVSSPHLTEGLLPEGIPVVVGAGDVESTLVGLGPVSRPTVILYLGTAAWIAQIEPPPERDPGSGKRGFTLAGIGATSTTGSALKWVGNLLGEMNQGAPDYESLCQKAAQVPPGSEGLFFLPHLMGERGPKPNPLQKGAFVGLSLYHSQGHLIRSVLEGTAFQIRRIWDAFHSRKAFSEREVEEDQQWIVCGGGARGSLWVQILASVLKVPLKIPQIPEAGAYGAARLTGLALGLEWPWLFQSQSFSQEIPPNPQWSDLYEEWYSRYVTLDERLSPCFGQ